MCRVIKLVPLYPGRDAGTLTKIGFRQTLISSTFSLARTALWPNRSFSEKEKLKCFDHLKLYYQSAYNPSNSFIALCEIILIARRHIAAPDQPRSWLNPENPKGFKALSALKQAFGFYSIEYPEIYFGIHAFATGYLQFIQGRSASQYIACESTLLEAGEYSRSQLFRTTISNLNYQ